MALQIVYTKNPCKKDYAARFIGSAGYSSLHIKGFYFPTVWICAYVSLSTTINPSISLIAHKFVICN